MMLNHTHGKLFAIRSLMNKQNISVLIIPTADPHLSEYLPKYWQTRAWVSGFTGSAGTLIVTESQAILWTDSRYWEQAEQQLLDSSIQLGRINGSMDIKNWIIHHTDVSSRVVVPSQMISVAQFDEYKHYFSEHKLNFEAIDDFFDEIWLDRGSLPDGQIYRQNSQYVFLSIEEKISSVRRQLLENHVDVHLISSLDDIAWITNLRGNDIEFNPVFLSHMVITPHECILFVDKSKLTHEIVSLLNHNGITIADYHAILDFMQKITGKLWIDNNKIAVSTLVNLSKTVELYCAPNPSTILKAQKSLDEINCIKNAMIKDGVALCQFFADFEMRLAAHESISEYDIDAMLIHYRSQQKDYISPSFDTIAGFNANGAMPHYRAEQHRCAKIEGNGLLLIDSGAQYHDGTTDITRVVPIGQPTDLQKKDFTLVLKSHIALATAVFPENLPAPMIDAICRKPMWQQQCDYGHGTGHGVGYCLNVHEAPQSISYRGRVTEYNILQEGMITSNEPALYRTGQWGIRIENLVVNRKMPQPSEFGTFLYFETVTLCPIDTRLVDKSMLNDEEISWLNQYHQLVREKLSPFLLDNAKTWLLERTEPI